MTAIPVVRVAGGPIERGVATGRALAESIHRSLGFYRGYLERRGIERRDLPRVLSPFRVAAEARLPELVAEVDALAQGAEADPWEVFAVNAFEELEPLLSVPAIERCTAFSATGPGGTILAHNEQWYAGDLDNVAVVVAEPEDGIAFASPLVVACLPSVGMNAAGAALAIMSLTATDDGGGIPRVLVSRHALQAFGPEDAFARSDIGGRAGGYALLFAFPGGETFTIETTARTAAMIKGPAAHTNHYLHPDLTHAGDPPGDGSVGRLERARFLLREGPPSTPEEAMSILADHSGSTESLCVHPDSADGDDAEAVLFSMVCHVDERRMWVAAGPPCTAPFEEIDIREVA